jgi:uncharacterized GH25 family protein
MTVRLVSSLAAAFLGGLLCLPAPVAAHRAWMLPSATVLSGGAQWVTVDAAVSNDLFYFEHNPLRLDNLTITAPDGSSIKPENSSTGKFRSTFDVPIRQPGTYKLAVVNQVIDAMYEDAGEVKRWRGSPEAFAREVPASAVNLQTSKTVSRLEVFVTSGKPTQDVLKPTGVGLELEPMTHPNDLLQGEPATFRLLRDGKPAADVMVAVVPGGIRYRDNLNERSFTTDRDGKFTVTFPEPGMYWMSAMVRSGGAAREGDAAPGAGPGMAAGGGQSGAPAQPPFRRGERLIYTATLEVMAK